MHGPHDDGRRDGPAWASALAQDPPWYGPGRNHVWLPYAQMKTATPPLPVVALLPLLLKPKSTPSHSTRGLSLA